MTRFRRVRRAVENANISQQPIRGASFLSGIKGQVIARQRPKRRATKGTKIVVIREGSKGVKQIRKERRSRQRRYVDNIFGL